MNDRRNGTCKEVAIRRSRGRQHHEKGVSRQLEIGERTYGSIGRENCPTFAGWKETPVTDLIAVLKNERAYEVMLQERRHTERHPVEEEESLDQCCRREST